MFPSFLDVLRVHGVIEPVILRYLRYLDRDISRAASLKHDSAVSELVPLLELPFHPDSFVFLQLGVLCLDRITEELMSSANSEL